MTVVRTAEAHPGAPLTRDSSRVSQVALLATAVLLAMSPWFSASAVLPQLRSEWRLDGGAEAWMTMSVQLGFVAGALTSAILNLPDRLPVPALFGASALAAAAVNAAIAVFVHAPGPALVLRFATGFALAGVYPPGMKLAASWCLRDRGLCIGVLVGALTFGSALPHLLNALAPGGAGMPGWRGVLLATSALAAVAGVMATVALRPGPHLARSAPFDWRFVRRALGHRPTRLANLGYLGHMWELYAMWAWVPLLLLASYGAAGSSAASARLAGFGVVAAGAVGCVAAGLLADRLGRTAVTTASLVVSGACALTAGLVLDDPVGLTALCLVWGFAVVADSAQFSAAVSELADPRYVGTALALQTSLGFLLTLLTIRLVPVLREEAGWGAALAMLAVGPAFGVVAMLRLRALPEARKLAGGRR